MDYIKNITITRFLRGEYRFERQGLNIEEQKSEISLCINNAEMQLRKLVKNTLLSSVGLRKATDAVLDAMNFNNAIDSYALRKAESLSCSQLFDPSMNKIYFSCLMGIILDNLQVFVNVFEPWDGDTIRAHLTTINNSRRCPDHSYTEDSEQWSWDDFLRFRESISWLEGILKNYE